MNFFGHAVISRRIGPAALAGTSGYALGAMLPDFASMCGGRLEGVAEPEVAAGVALHHRTDDAFHHHPTVVGLMRELHERLLGAGCGVGPARAGSHIGVELLLDGVLVDDPASRALYVEALERPPPALTWREARHEVSFQILRERLRGVGAPEDLREPSAVTKRLVHVLSRRPRLAATARDAAILGDVLAAYRARVAVAAEAVLRGVLAGLAEPSSTAP
ncbi:MAG: hypothetical protein R3B48_12895 [Kofleriaceae bacterium]